MALFSIFAICSLVEVDRCFRGDLIVLKLEGASISKTSGSFYQITMRTNPDGNRRRTCRRKNRNSTIQGKYSAKF